MLVRCTYLLGRWLGQPGPSVSVRYQASSFAILGRKVWMMQYLPSSLIKQLQSRTSPVGSGVAYKARLVLGIGVASGITVSLLKYVDGGGTYSCSSSYPSQDWTLHTTPGVRHSIDLSETAKVSVQQFSLVQRLYLVIRFMYLCFLFSPAALLYGMSHVLGRPSLAGYGWRYILSVLETAGPAFIKLAQWASMRRDLFTEDFCQTLSWLHVCCPCHSWPETVQQLEQSLGPHWKDQLVIDDHTPIGSGCVAQVYEGRLYVGGGEGRVSGGGEGRISGGISGGEGGKVGGGDSSDRVAHVAVKVLHPNIVMKVKRDIYLMKYVTSWVDTVYPDVYWVALTECVDQFSSIMERQVR